MGPGFVDMCLRVLQRLQQVAGSEPASAAWRKAAWKKLVAARTSPARR
jgi:hypothetical protein